MKYSELFLKKYIYKHYIDNWHLRSCNDYCIPDAEIGRGNKAVYEFPDRTQQVPDFVKDSLTGISIPADAFSSRSYLSYEWKSLFIYSDSISRNLLSLRPSIDTWYLIILCFVPAYIVCEAFSFLVCFSACLCNLLYILLSCFRFTFE